MLTGLALGLLLRRLCFNCCAVAIGINHAPSHHDYAAGSATPDPVPRTETVA